jgi:hypothetical protein
MNELKERIADLELAANGLWLLVQNDRSSFYNDEFLKQNLVKVLKERAAAARRLEQLRRDSVGQSAKI